MIIALPETLLNPPPKKKSKSCCSTVLFTCITVHGFIPEHFLPSSVVPVPKKRGCNASATENFSSIALSSIFQNF